MKKFACFILAAICIFSLSLTAFGAEGQKVSIVYRTEKAPLADVQFSFYRIGNVSGDKIMPDNPFDSYSVSFDISDAEKKTSLAMTLSAYVLRDDIKPHYTDKTDKNGIADFDKKTFPDGAYLYVGEKHYQNGKTYFCEPAIVVLPSGDSATVTVKPKCEVVPDIDGDNGCSIKVIKAWLNDDKNKRPVRIEIELLKDGEIYDTVTLSEKNNWQYKWDKLSSEYHWTVTEKTVSKGYVVSLSKTENIFLLVNKWFGEEDVTSPEEPTTSNDTPTSPGEVTTRSPETTTSSQNTTLPKDPTLPQTGSLRWPIPYLAGAGVFLFIIGYAVYRKSDVANE